MGADTANALERLAPGAPGTGTTVTFTVTSPASAFQVLPWVQTSPSGKPNYVTVKVIGSSGVYLCFGDSAVGAPTSNDFLIEPSDGPQEYMLPSNWNGFRALRAGAVDVTLKVTKSGT